MRRAAADVEGTAAAARVGREKPTPLGEHLRDLVSVRGPIPIASFMAEALTSPLGGYYTTRSGDDVFGARGDFVTAPEVSQVVGELIGVWAALVWRAMGEPKKWRLVEVGPGKGTLMADLLRGTAPSSSATFSAFRSSLQEVCLVEVSDTLAARQAAALGGDAEEIRTRLDERRRSGSPSIVRLDADETKHPPRPTLSWHEELASVPQDMPEVVILHELMDALPVHQFVKVADDDAGAGRRGVEWRERLVDVAGDDDNDQREGTSPYNLRFVLSPGPTPASFTVLRRRLDMMPPGAAARIENIEVCPRALAMAEELANRASTTGGASLIIDYGEDHPSDSSLRAIRKHRLVHPLSRPGESDLSCGVDFSALRDAVEHLKRGNASPSAVHATGHGTISQADFFHAMGIVPRMEMLGRNAATDAERDEIRKAYVRLVGTGDEKVARDTDQGGHDSQHESQFSPREEGMGIAYKCFAITADSIGIPPAFLPVPPSPPSHDDDSVRDRGPL